MPKIKIGGFIDPTKKKKDKLKTPAPPAKLDKKKKPDKPKRFKKGQAEFILGKGIRAAGKKLSKSASSEAEKTFALKDKLHAERKKMQGKKRKS